MKVEVGVVDVGVDVDTGVDDATAMVLLVFVIVHVAFCPATSAMVPFAAQSPVMLSVYEELTFSLTVYVPAASVYAVPDAATPGAGLPATSVLDASTWRVKSEGTAVLPFAFTTSLTT